MKVIICEKPSVAREFAKVLGVSSSASTKGYIENNEWIITWAVGHLITLSYPEKYNPELAKWRLNDLPFIPETFKYEPIKGVKEQFDIVKKILQRKDVEIIYNAGDSGREGEYIQRLIFQEAKPNPNAKMMRIWIDSQTEEAIKSGIQNAKPMSEYDSLSDAAYERAIEDYLAGINFSRAYSLRYGNALNHIYGSKSYIPFSVGRVMTCVLGMIVERERLVRNYKAEFSYGVNGTIPSSQNNIEDDISAEWFAGNTSQYFESPLLAKENAFFEQKHAEKLCSECNHEKTLCVSDVNKKTEQKKAPLLFNLAELQAECARIYKISPTETLDIAQSLYEKKLTTYPRTDARVLSSAVAAEIKKNISGLSSITDLSEFTQYILTENTYQSIANDLRYTDDAQITDHYAIIPTGHVTSFGSLNAMERQVYDLICRRFLSIFYPSAEFSKINVIFKQGNESFKANATILKLKGWKEVMNYEEDEEKALEYQILHRFTIGQRFQADFTITEKKTAKPKRFTSGTLVLAMENAGKLIEDEELRAQISENGIGTSSTRAETMNKLVKNQYINLNNKTQIITPTELGEMIYCVVSETVNSLLNPAFTANWEKGLSQIQDKVITASDYRAKLIHYVSTKTNELKETDRSEIINQKLNDIHILYGGKPVDFRTSYSNGAAIVGAVCPNCGGEIVTTPWGFKCVNYKETCDFTVGEIAGVKLNEKQLIKILTTGESSKLEFKKKDKSGTYTHTLTLQDDGKNGKKIWLKPFNSSSDSTSSSSFAAKKTSCTCPNCNHSIMTTPWGFKCEKCKFSIGTIGGVKISEEQLKEILYLGKTKEMLSFQKKDGSGVYEAYLSLQDDDTGGKKIWLSFN